MSVIQVIENFINGELQVIADELKHEIVDIQYDEMMEDYARWIDHTYSDEFSQWDEWDV